MKPEAKRRPAYWCRAVLRALPADYAREVERIAQALRPRFEVGELRGFRSGDGDRAEAEDRAWQEAHPRARNRACVRAAGAWERLPHALLEEEVTRRMNLRDFRTAALVLALSPSSERVPHGDGCEVSVLGMATDAAVWDVLRVARARRWYRPTRDELPTARELGKRAPTAYEACMAAGMPNRRKRRTAA